MPVLPGAAVILLGAPRRWSGLAMVCVSGVRPRGGQALGAALLLSLGLFPAQRLAQELGERICELLPLQVAWVPKAREGVEVLF